jgi:hypothetical protein
MSTKQRRLTFTERWIRFWHRRAPRHPHLGLDVRYAWLAIPDAEHVLPKLFAAIDLLADTSPKHFARVRRHVRGLMLFPTPGANAQWVESLGLILIAPEYVVRPEIPVAEVASAIVHEATHGWLGSLGIGYDEPARGRVERVCIAAQVAFVRKVPGADDTREILEMCLDVGELTTAYSRVALMESELRGLRDLGTPEFLIRVVRAIARRRAA